MKKVMWYGVAAAMLLVLGGCAGKKAMEKPRAEEAQTSAYQKISPEELKQLFKEGTEFTLVDVRQPEEYEEGHIPSAINVVNEEISNSMPEALPDKDAVIVVYCRSGRRSKEAADKMVKLGYKDIRDMGGILDWDDATVAGSNPGEWN